MSLIIYKNEDACNIVQSFVVGPLSCLILLASSWQVAEFKAEYHWTFGGYRAQANLQRHLIARNLCT